MRQHSTAGSVRQQYRVAQQVKQVDANHFFNLLTSPRLLGLVEDQLPEHRERKYPPTVTLSMFLGQVMSADGSCQNAVNEAMVARLLSGMTTGSVNTSAYCQARARLPTQMVRTLAQGSAVLLSEQALPGWLWRGRHVKLVDGSSASMADTPQNRARFPQPRHHPLGVGFPLARWVAVLSLCHGAVLEMAMGPYQGKGTGEYGLFRELRECFVAGDVMLADSYFCSYFLIAEMSRRGVDVLFEQHGARMTDFRCGTRLGVRDHLMRWRKPQRPQWMSAEDYQEYADEMTVREVRVGRKVLVTTLLDAGGTPKGALGDLFAQRWQVELDLRNIKSTLGMEVFSCKTPPMVEKQLWVYLLAYNLIRLLMAEAASQARLLPRQLSFKHTVQIWVAWSQRQFASTVHLDTAGLFALIAQRRVGNRPGRIEPRMIKRRPKPYTYLGAPRSKARMRIRKRGHDKKLRA